MDDLFAAPAPPPSARPALRFVNGQPCRVASFVCDCGAQEEVKEPAPREVACWQKGCPGPMRRWSPRYCPPWDSARETTAAERA